MFAIKRNQQVARAILFRFSHPTFCQLEEGEKVSLMKQTLLLLLFPRVFHRNCENVAEICLYVRAKGISLMPSRGGRRGKTSRDET
jgi:hypothetical protein